MTNPSDSYPMRLQRFLARAGVSSRRGSERLMTEGRVRVNGTVVTELGSKIDPLRDEVSVDGKVCTLADRHCYLLLNKTAGYLTTMSDPYGRPTVADLVPVDEYPGLYPVGRLDADTTGCLLFTTDGRVGQNLLHPSHNVDKTYIACISGSLSETEISALEHGVEMDGCTAAPARVEVIEAGDRRLVPVRPDGLREREQVVSLTVHEGRKHQVKRMFFAVGHLVKSLHRARFGPLEAGSIPEGSWRPCTDAEIDALFSAAGLERGG